MLYLLVSYLLELFIILKNVQLLKWQHISTKKCKSIYVVRIFFFLTFIVILGICLKYVFVCLHNICGRLNRYIGCLLFYSIDTRPSSLCCMHIYIYNKVWNNYGYELLCNNADSISWMGVVKNKYTYSQRIPKLFTTYSCINMNTYYMLFSIYIKFRINKFCSNVVYWPII